MIIKPVKKRDLDNIQGNEQAKQERRRHAKPKPDPDSQNAVGQDGNERDRRRSDPLDEFAACLAIPPPASARAARLADR